MSCFITPPVGFNYCIHGDDICSFSLETCKGIVGGAGNRDSTTKFNIFSSLYRKPTVQVAKHTRNWLLDPMTLRRLAS